MRHRLGLLLATAAVMAVTGCGSTSSSTTATPPAASSSGPIADSQVLPLVSIPGIAAHTTTLAAPLSTAAQRTKFLSQFPAPPAAKRVEAALERALANAGANVVGAVVASGCDVPPGVHATADGQGGVTIVADPVPSPLQECLVPVTTIALVRLP